MTKSELRRVKRNLKPVCELRRVNPRRHEEKKVARKHEPGESSEPPPPSIFKSIQPIDMKLGLCNKCPVHFQLSIATGHLIGFHGNHFQNSKKAAISPSFGIYNFFFLKKTF